MAVRITTTPVRVTVAVSGEIDHHNAAIIRYEADEAIQSALAPNVRIDFGDVTFMDSSGIGFVMGRYRIVNSYGGNVEVVNLTDRIYSMMKLAGLDKLVTLRKKTEKGL
ncbi:MAG: STAS domain-containing protein [Clostridia bacterium]|nr:STAS domain-containing protein [Clostridia bacterium]